MNNELFILHSSFSIIMALTVCEDSGGFLFHRHKQRGEDESPPLFHKGFCLLLEQQLSRGVQVQTPVLPLMTASALEEGVRHATTG